MKKYYLKISCFILSIFFGIFMFVYGGYDDSPGGQGLGLVLLAVGIGGLIRTRRKLTKQKS